MLVKREGMTCSHGTEHATEPGLPHRVALLGLVLRHEMPRDSQMMETEYLLSSESTPTGVVCPGSEEHHQPAPVVEGSKHTRAEAHISHRTAPTKGKGAELNNISIHQQLFRPLCHGGYIIACPIQGFRPCAVNI